MSRLQYMVAPTFGQTVLSRASQKNSLKSTAPYGTLRSVKDANSEREPASTVHRAPSVQRTVYWNVELEAGTDWNVGGVRAGVTVLHLT